MLTVGDIRTSCDTHLTRGRLWQWHAMAHIQYNCVAYFCPPSATCWGDCGMRHNDALWCKTQWRAVSHNMCRESVPPVGRLWEPRRKKVPHPSTTHWNLVLDSLKLYPGLTETFSCTHLNSIPVLDSLELMWADCESQKAMKVPHPSQFDAMDTV